MDLFTNQPSQRTIIGSNQGGRVMSEVKYDSQPMALEKWLDENLNKKFPVQLPDGAKKWLADNSWWLALIGGGVSLWGAWRFWQLGHTASQFLNGLSQVYGVNTYSQDLSVFWYVVFAAMLVQAVLLLMAFQKLKVHKKSGWNLLLYSSYVSVITGVVYLMLPYYGFGSLLGTALGAVISWYILFQVRSHFAK